MKHQNTPRRRAARLACALLLALAALAPAAAVSAGALAQTAPEPRREQLLNGLRILTLQRPGDSQLLMRLRVHSGAAFDLAGKEGLLALLGDALFDAQTREYVSEELGGRLEVSTDYDAIDVTLAGRAQDFDRLLELLRNAVTNPQLTPEAVRALRDARLKSLGQARTAGARADRAAAARLFNVHPYGRDVAGTPESIGRVERNDLLVARDRFLNPNNATLVVVGDVEHRRVMGALRQALGAWRKSDRVVPETFRRPEAADARVLLVGEPAQDGGSEVRLAVRGLARNDRDRPAAQLLAYLARERWAVALPELRGRLEVRHDARRDGGTFLLSASARTPAEAARALETGRAVINALAAAQPSAAEFEAARNAYLAALAGNQGPEGWALAWLDEHSYKTPSVTPAQTARAIAALTPAEAQRVAARLFQHTPSAAVVVGDAAALRAELARLGEVEVMGESAAGQASAPARPQAPPAQSPQPGLQLKRP